MFGSLLHNCYWHGCAAHTEMALEAVLNDPGGSPGGVMPDIVITDPELLRDTGDWRGAQPLPSTRFEGVTILPEEYS